MKRLSVILVASILVMVYAIPAYAMDSRVKASKSTIYFTLNKVTDKANGWKKGRHRVGAKGYVTSSAYHYTNVELLDVGYFHIKYSGRKWGKGKVWADTGYAKNHDPLIVDDHSAVYYGFDK